MRTGRKIALLSSALALGAVLATSGATPALANTAAELRALKEQMAIMAKRLEELEAKQTDTEEKIEENRKMLSADADSFVAALRDYLSRAQKPILTVGRWRESPDWEQGVMMIQEPEDAARMMARMVEYGQYLNGIEKPR